MSEYANVTMDMIYNELLKIRKEISVVEHAVIPIERLPPKELEGHKQDLKEALQEKRINFREL